jgi:hypothetical protein
MKISNLNKIFGFNVIQVVIVGMFFLLIWPQRVSAQESYEAYYHFLGDYPYEENGFAGPWTGEAQGLAHDDSHWFITQNCTETADTCCIPIPRIWKIHVTEDLQAIDGDWDGSGNVLVRSLSSIPQLAGYNHLGDPDYYMYNGTGYLLVGIAGDTVNNGVAVFNAADLSYICHTIDLITTSQDGWVAVDRSSEERFVYFPSTRNSLGHVDKYFLNWHALHTIGECYISNVGSFKLVKEDGVSGFPDTHYFQGGEFSPSGDLLYMSTGRPDPDHDEGHPYPYQEGIHVFDTRTWTRIQQSTLGYGYFNFLYDPYGIDSEEPEGLTIWDLDGGGAPGINGQLHVLLLDNDADDCDDIYLKHYRASRDIYVDSSYIIGEEHGTTNRPFRTVTAANNVAWNGAVLHIRPGLTGSYPETLLFNKQMEVLATGGNVTIGQ